jgi:hypothetical protein
MESRRKKLGDKDTEVRHEGHNREKWFGMFLKSKGTKLFIALIHAYLT